MEDIPKVVMCGLPRCGKTSISKVVFQKLSPHESMFLEGGLTKMETFSVCHNHLLRLRLVDFPGAILCDENLSLHQNDATVFGGGDCVVVLVIDAQDESYATSVSRAKKVIEFALKRNSKLTFDVLIHKVDGAKFHSEERKMECQTIIHDKLTEELADKVQECTIHFHCTSIYDHSIFEAFSKIVQKLIPEKPLLENCLQSLLDSTRMEKVYLFDVVSKLYLASDRQPVDLQWYELCADMVDLVIDIACIYGNGLEENKDAACEFNLQNGAVLILKEVGHCLAIVCVFKSDDTFDKHELLDHNIEVFKEALGRICASQSDALRGTQRS
ncbi:unnamed protein product [Durusdinium trenchii]|uniref:Uncharacterized protein n=2 Tax=Durusdinium trenchii TaxID=1381693 RepID=A0ABP0NQH7_9DINO